MKYKLTKERLEEIVCCIVDNGLDRDEAGECLTDDSEITDVEC